jgi:hypothetical protein
VSGHDFVFSAKLWRWQSASAPAAWYFLTLPADMAVEIRLRATDRRKGFGSVRVEATIGATTWRTSIFPASNLDSYLLPVKAAVRRAEGLEAEDAAEVGINLLEA